MSSWLNRLSKNNKAKTRQLSDPESGTVEQGPVEKQVIPPAVPISHSEQKSPSDSVRSIIERAIADAERLAASIKTKAQKEAEDEAARIIDKARQGADELMQQAKSGTQKETDDILEGLNAKARLIEEGAKQKVESLLLQARQEIEKGVKEEYKEAHSRLIRSLMRGAEEMMPAAEAQAPLQNKQEPVPANKEPEAKLAAKEEVKKKAGEPKEARMPESGRKGKLSGLLKIGLNKKAEEDREPKMPADGQKSKLSGMLKIGPGKKAEDQEQKTPASSLKGRLNSLANLSLSKKGKDTQPTVEQKTEKAVQPEKEANAVKPVESVTKKQPEMPLPGEQTGEQEPGLVPQNLDGELVYQGEVELAIGVPVEPAAVSRLCNYLQTTPDVKILYTRGSRDRGTTITVSLDKPLPFIGMISAIQGLAVTPGLPQKEILKKAGSKGANKKEPARIDLVLKSK